MEPDQAMNILLLFIDEDTAIQKWEPAIDFFRSRPICFGCDLCTEYGKRDPTLYAQRGCNGCQDNCATDCGDCEFCEDGCEGCDDKDEDTFADIVKASCASSTEWKGLLEYLDVDDFLDEFYLVEG